MATFQPINAIRFIPESYLPTAPYIPLHFMAQVESMDATNFDFELDELGQLSIIHLVKDDEVVVPYIDLTKYDNETKDWFWYDSVNKFPYRYIKSTNKLENIYPSEYSSLTPFGTFSFDKDNLNISGGALDLDGTTVSFIRYSPLILAVNNEAYLDLSDYSTFKPSDRLNKADTTVKEFYYDFDSRIYTNQNLAGVDPKNIKIIFFKISDNKVKVKCRLSANLGTETYFTPKVNNFILKLKGQSLRF